MVGQTTLAEGEKVGQIFLYGEQHAVEKILHKELELWDSYYHEANMRHLFIEMPYYTAEFLNLWMKSETDQILEEIYADWAGTAAQNLHVKRFYQVIKEEYPETIFHGTDVGHQFQSTGQRFLTYLIGEGLQASEQYKLAREAILQGSYFYSNNDHVYRENKMTENFIREFSGLQNESVMGIYGGAHVDFEALDYMTKSVPSMANQLKKVYGDRIFSEDLGWLAKDIEPFRVDTITLNDQEYKAAYFGKEDLRGFRDFLSREFWRLENAYEDFKENEKLGNVLPYDNYPMLIEEGQVFVIDYTKIDGSVMRHYYRSDGNVWNGLPVTEQFVL